MLDVVELLCARADFNDCVVVLVQSGGLPRQLLFLHVTHFN